jgi:hypothetical protein
MKDELDDLLLDVGVCLQDAYRRGFEKGNTTNKALLDNKKDMLAKFEAYLSTFRRLEGEDKESIFLKKSDVMPRGIFLETLIKNFLLSYDDEENI